MPLVPRPLLPVQRLPTHAAAGTGSARSDGTAGRSIPDDAVAQRCSPKSLSVAPSSGHRAPTPRWLARPRSVPGAPANATAAPVHRGAVIVAVADLGLTRVHRQPHLDRRRRRPVLLCERVHDPKRRGRGRGLARVNTTNRLSPSPRGRTTTPLCSATTASTSACGGPLPRPSHAALAPTASRADHIGEEKGHRPHRQPARGEAGVSRGSKICPPSANSRPELSTTPRSCLRMTFPKRQDDQTG